MHLFAEVKIQISLLFSFKTDYFTELTCIYNYTDEVAWKFIGVCVRAIFDFLAPPRLAVAGLEDLSARPVKAQIIWAIMQVHLRFNELIKADFKAHPVLTRAMSAYIMKNRVDGSQLEAVKKRVSVVETQVKTTANELWVVKAHKVFK